MYNIYNIWYFFKEMVKITFKSPTQAQPFTLDVNVNTIGSVLKLKEQVGAHTGDPAANIKLIHKGIYDVK